LDLHPFIDNIAEKNQGMFSPVSALIPAAGVSDRMGKDKALLPYGNGLCFAENLINCFSNYGCNPVVLVVNETFDTAQLRNCDFMQVINHNLDLGRSYSIHLGLQLIPKGTSCFIHNIDNPFIEKKLLYNLMEAIEPDNYTVPVFEGKRGHPVLLGKSAAEHLRGQPFSMDFRDKLKKFPGIEVSWPDKRILWNINTPEDYIRFTEESRL
jgi:CTP:molybdopterin cytidylyltransferase MocA